MNKKDLALNDLQWLICHKTTPNQTKQNETKQTFILTEILKTTSFNSNNSPTSFISLFFPPPTKPNLSIYSIGQIEFSSLVKATCLGE